MLALRPGASVVRWVVPAILGATLAVALYPVWNLEGRWLFVVLVGLVMLAVSMVFAGRFSEFVLLAMMFCIPVAGFTKWLFIDEYPEDDRNAMPTSGMFGLGIIDFMLAGLYMAWAFRIFALREEPLPRLRTMDLWVLFMVLASALSIWGARDPWLSAFSLEHIVKHALVYLYLSRHLQRRHVPWMLGAFAVALLVQAGIGAVQNQFGILRGLMADKGAGGDKLNYQYEVPGIENVNRAMGTTYDSHSLGLYLAMLLPFVLVFLFREQPPRLRLAFAALLLIGLPTLVITYSRSGWLSTAISLGICGAVLLAWRERYAVRAAFVVGIAGIFAAPWLLSKVFSRFIDAPEDLLRGRFEQFPIAWSMWKENLLTGIGGGNYMLGLREHNLNWAYDMPVHNIPLFLGAEMGLLGVVSYYGVAIYAFILLVRLIRSRVEPDCRMALAGLAALVAALFDGMSNPHFREPPVYMMFWLIVAMSVAFTRERSEAKWRT